MMAFAPCIDRLLGVEAGWAQSQSDDTFVCLLTAFWASAPEEAWQFFYQTCPRTGQEPDPQASGPALMNYGRLYATFLRAYKVSWDAMPLGAALVLIEHMSDVAPSGGCPMMGGV